MRRVARVVASLWINVFAMEFMVEISCLRKSATSSFCKVLLHKTRWPWFRESLDLGPVIVILMFSKMQKSVVFLVFTALLVRWDLAFAGSFCRLPLCGSATAFAGFSNNKFQEFLKNSYYSRPHLLAQKRAILPNFWCFWRMTFREMEQFVLERSLVLFVVDNFRLHRFFHKKHHEKVDFLVFIFYRCEFLSKGNQCSILV